MKLPGIPSVKCVKRITTQYSNESREIKSVMATIMYAAYLGVTHTQIAMSTATAKKLDAVGFSTTMEDFHRGFYKVSWDNV